MADVKDRHARAEDEGRLLPMLVGGLILIVIGMIGVMAFV